MEKLKGNNFFITARGLGEEHEGIPARKPKKSQGRVTRTEKRVTEKSDY